MRLIVTKEKAYYFLFNILSEPYLNLTEKQQKIQSKLWSACALASCALQQLC